MATRRGANYTEQDQEPSISPSKGIELIQRQIEAGKKLMAERLVDEYAYETWRNMTINYLFKAFGKIADNVIGFQALGELWDGLIDAGDAGWEQAYRAGLRAKLARLEDYIEVLRTEIALEEAKPPVVTPIPKPPHLSARRVFVVHGHNEGLREMCARFLEKLELLPIILHEQPNYGPTIIEKFHDYSDVGFAVVLLTGDDLAIIKGGDVAHLKLRARQNVILELGFLLAKLGRSRVCAIYEPAVELPTEYDGVLFIKLDSEGAWRFQLCRELKAAGIDVDLNKAV